MKALLFAIALAACVGKPARPGAWKLVTGANQPGGLRSPRLVWDPDLHAIVMYGGDRLDMPSDAMWSFTGSAWQKLCDPCGVQRHRNGFTWDGQQLVSFAGEDTSNGDAYTSDVFTYGSSWRPETTTGDVPLQTTFAQLVAYHDRLYAIGGYSTGGPSVKVASLSGMIWRAEPDAGDTMASTGSESTVDTEHDRILSLVDTTGNTEEDGVWAFDGTTWDKLCEPCTGVAKHGASLIHVPGHDVTLLLGGELHDQSFVAGSRVLQGSTFVPYDDPVTYPARADVGVAYDPERDLVVVYGGASEDCQFGCDETWELTPE